MRAKIALNLKRVRYENLEEVLDNESELLRKSNPVYKKVPVLLHAGKPVCESMITVQYIDEVWPETGPALMPTDPYDRAVARFWAVFIDDKWFPFPRPTVIIRGQTGEAKEEAMKQLIAGLVLLEEAFEKCSKGKGFFTGANIGYLDIALGCHLEWIWASEKLGGSQNLDKEKTPLLFSWAPRFYSNNAVKEAMQGVEKLAEYPKMSQAKWTAALTK